MIPAQDRKNNLDLTLFLCQHHGGLPDFWFRVSGLINRWGAKPLRLIGLAWLSSTPLVSTFLGYFLAQSMQVGDAGKGGQSGGGDGGAA